MQALFKRAASPGSSRPGKASAGVTANLGLSARGMAGQLSARLRRFRQSWPLWAVLSGILYALSFCGFEQDWLTWFCLTPVLWVFGQGQVHRLRDALKVGWLMGFVAHMGVYTWLVGMLADFGGLPWVGAVVGYTIICAAQSFLFGLWGMGMFILHKRLGVQLLWAAPVTMVLAEWLTPALFPSYLANSLHSRIVMIQACELWGVLGLTFAATLVGSCCYALLVWALGRAPFPKLGLFATSGLLTFMLVFGYRTVAQTDAVVAGTERSLTVGLVQTNMGIFEKTTHPNEGLKRHREQSLEIEAQKVDLIIWSESGYYYALEPAVHNVKQQVLGRLQTPLLFGGMRVAYGQAGPQMFNSAFLTDSQGELMASYDKTHLVAFGEFLPFGDYLPVLYQLSPQTSHFYRGSHVRPMSFKGLRLGTLICYEDILPQFVRRVMDQHPDILINITNDAWFGESKEPRIHLALATFRAVEQRRFLVRATNTGISAIIDPVGRVLGETPTFARANLIGTVKPMYGLTFYQQVGDWPGYGCLLFFVWRAALGLWRRFRGPAPAPARS